MKAIIYKLFFIGWSFINIALFACIVYWLLKFIPSINSKIRTILTVLGTLVYVLFFGISFKPIHDINKRALIYPYTIEREHKEFRNLGAFAISGLIEYETSNDTLLQSRFIKGYTYLKGLTLGYHWDTTVVTGKFYIHRNKREYLGIETKGTLEWQLLGIKVRQTTYELAAHTIDANDYND
jgi:hypothetical protein